MGVMKNKKEEKKPDPLIVSHHEARRDYFVLESMEAGIMLKGSEVKSLREARSSLSGSFARFEKNELFIYNFYIAPYDKAGKTNPPDPNQPRKLLMRRAQLEKIHAQVKEKSVTLIPLKLYWNVRGIAKVELAIAKGKKLFDKRAEIKKDTVRREIDRAIKNRNRK